MRFFTSIFGAVFLATCLIALATETRFLKIVSLAVYSEVSTDQFSDYHATAEKIMATSPQSCRRDIRTSRATIAIFSHQRLSDQIESNPKEPVDDSTDNIKQKETRLQNIYQELLFSLRCTPFDSKAWLRLAWLVNESSTTFPELTLSELIESSIIMSPFEYWSIVGRIMIVSERISEEDVDLKNLITYDLGNIIELGTVNDSTDILGQITDIPLSIVNEILDEVPDEKRQEIVDEYYRKNPQ